MFESLFESTSLDCTGFLGQNKTKIMTNLMSSLFGIKPSSVIADALKLTNFETEKETLLVKSDLTTGIIAG